MFGNKKVNGHINQGFFLIDFQREDKDRKDKEKRVIIGLDIPICGSLHVGFPRELNHADRLQQSCTTSRRQLSVIPHTHPRVSSDSDYHVPAMKKPQIIIIPTHLIQVRTTKVSALLVECVNYFLFEHLHPRHPPIPLERTFFSLTHSPTSLCCFLSCLLLQAHNTRPVGG